MNFKTTITLLLMMTALLNDGRCQKRKRYNKSKVIDNVGFFIGMEVSGFTRRVGPYSDRQTYDYNSSPVFGLNTALFLKKEIKNDWLLHLEIDYSQKGGGVQRPNGDIIMTTNGVQKGTDASVYRLDYLEFPILLGKRISNNYTSRLSADNYFSFGIMPSILLRQRFVEFDGSKEDIDLANKYNASIVAEYNYALRLKLPLFAILRLVYTPFDLFKEDEVDGDNYKTNSFGGTFGFGLIF